MGHSSASARLRAVLTLVGVGLLLAWVFRTRPLESVALGPGAVLVARTGVDLFAVRDDAGSWRAFSPWATSAADGFELPTGLRGRPVLDAEGGIHVLASSGLVRALPGEERLLLPEADLPDDVALEGITGRARVVLSAPAGRGRRLLTGQVDPHTSALVGELRVVRRAEGEARWPTGEVLVCSPFSEALAFPGPDDQGWEAWSLTADGGARRAVAEGCSGPGALFTPNGKHLLVPGRVDGLWLLSLADGRMSFMAEGNLGVSRRVGASHGFRGEPNRMLVAPQRSAAGYLHIFQTHLSGGGRYQFHTSFTHHFGVSLSHDGRFLVWGQAEFDDQGAGPFDEDLYLYDFRFPRRAARLLDTRPGEQADRGPVFVGREPSLAYISAGEVRLIRLDPEE